MTIVRNGEQFLAEALESALGQSYSDLELVVVDDGSTDRSAEIAERYVNAAPDRVRLVRHPDHSSRGMSATRSLGVRIAQGDFIVGDRDVRMGEIGGAPFYISPAQFEYWKHTQLIIDVVPGRGGMFSLEGPHGLRFLTRSRLYDDAEWLWLQASGRAPST